MVAETAGGKPGDVEAIRAAAAAYVAALERGDAAALAAAWTPDGDIVDEAGDVLRGRDTVAQDSSAQPAGPRPEVRINDSSLRFITADVAIEDGTVEVRPRGGSPLVGRFSATWVRHEGAWKLAALREARSSDVNDAGQLADLDWMVGEWAATEENGGPAGGSAAATVDMLVRWNPTKTYLIRELRLRPAGAATDAPGLSITQVIGWDPIARRIRGWAFGSDGSYGEALLSRDGGSWIAETKSVRADGSITTALNIYTYDGKDRCTWRSLPTHVGGERTPQVLMTMVRKPGSTKP